MNNKTKQIKDKIHNRLGRKGPKSLEAPEQVTKKTVSDHRDEILSRAKKFKYPFYRSKHKIVLLSLSVVALALIVLSLGMYMSLYRWQNTGTFSNNVSKILPFPVAKVDGSTVRYESYLFELRSALYWQREYGTTDLRSPDGKKQIEHFKRLALDRAMINRLAQRYADDNNITVNDAEVDKVVDDIKNNSSGGDLNKILGEQFGSSESEIRRSIRQSILRRKVATAMDQEAPKRAEAVRSEITSGGKFASVAKAKSDDLIAKQTGGSVGVVIKSKANLPDEVTDELFKLKQGEVSPVIKTASDYFIVKVDEKISADQVRASIIRIKVKPLEDVLADLKSEGKVTEYIKITDDPTQNNDTQQ